MEIYTNESWIYQRIKQTKKNNFLVCMTLTNKNRSPDLFFQRWGAVEVVVGN
jgi:hypothetical protein